MATTSTIPVSKNAIATILKDLPEEDWADIFWKSFVSEDLSLLTERKKKSITTAKKDFQAGDTIQQH